MVELNNKEFYLFFFHLNLIFFCAVLSLDDKKGLNDDRNSRLQFMILGSLIANLYCFIGVKRRRSTLSRWEKAL